MGKIQFPNLRALPAGPRWLAYGVLLLCAILVGGVITAYGGMLLVVLMWAVCMGGLCLLLHFTWQTVFPGQRVAQDKTFLRSWLAGSAVGVAVIAALVCYRQTVYSDDAINYFAKQTLLFGSFGQSGFYGIHVLLESLLTADYKMFMNLFISVPYLFTGRSINAFMVCYAITCFVPMWFALLMGAKYLAQQLPACHTALYYPLCMAVMVLWPMFLWPATHGMPDAFGLTFAAVIALLCADYRFETLPWPRLLAIFAATFALILTRRWYMFWILAFYAVYVLAVLVGAVRRKTLGSTLKHMLLFGVPSAVIIVGALLPTFKTILTTDYADIYGAYYGGGFGNNCPILVTAISQTRLVYHLHFAPHQFLDSLQRCHGFCLVTIKYPGTQLVIRCICHRTYHSNRLYRRLQRQCLLFVLQQDGRFHSSLLGSLQMRRSIKFLYPFLIHIRIIKQSQPEFDTQNIPHGIVYSRLLDLTFFYQFRQFLDKRIADHLHIHTSIHRLHCCLFRIGSKAMCHHFGYRSPV